MARGGGRRSAAPPEPEIDPLAPAAIAYTSGTTGFPKGAVHSQHNMLLPGRVSAQRGHVHPAGGVLGVALPLTILNLIILGPCMAYQCEMALVAMDRVDGLGMGEWIAAEKITTFSAVPAMVHDLLTNDEVDRRRCSPVIDGDRRRAGPTCPTRSAGSTRNDSGAGSGPATG